jgi:4-alpha-glucanotransferase
MKFNRSAGIILHPTSLPGPYGIGDIGPQAYRWIDFLAKSGTGLWQVLPLGPTGYADSPYQCFSAFAGNPYLISPEFLIEEGLLYPEDLSTMPHFPTEAVDYGLIYQWKPALLNRTYERFQLSGSAQLRASLDEFCQAQAAWLDDYALFMALKDAHGGAPWPTWDPPLRDRDPKALAKARQTYTLPIQQWVFKQFLFFRQWARLRAYVHEKDIQIIGDIPIFVAHDSADVWQHPELFFMGEDGKPTVVAGVPPDYFSPTGQLWGNPLYRWDYHKSTGYAWWLDRIRAVLNTVDIIRIDHFRGFAGYWEVPGNAVTAIDGQWIPGPRADFFNAVMQALGELPILAEDLGVITPDVVELRDGFGLPGMKILQFAFEGKPTDPFLPHNYPVNCVVYTGTHDNDTARGWYERVDEASRDFYRRYLARDGRDVAWDMIRAAWASVAMFALAPMQDLLSLGNEGRMNYPGNPSGNWTWRMPANALSPELCNRIRELNHLYSREKPQPTLPESV